MEATAAARIATGPRITPGSARELGRVNTAITKGIGAAVGGTPPHVFTTLARHRRLFRRWLAFAGALMPGGVLPRQESELLILRVAHNCGSDYERFQHERLAAEAGLSRDDIERVGHGPAAEGWTDRQQLLLRAADELHEARTISDGLWDELAGILNEVELIELCMLIGHYEMLAMTLNALAVEPDSEPAGQPTGVARVIRRLAERRR
jgi:alkylhydroperoxidase family enzyme